MARWEGRADEVTGRTENFEKSKSEVVGVFLKSFILGLPGPSGFSLQNER